MGKLLPVERSFSPYRYVTENLAAVRAEYLAESGQLEGCDVRRLQRLLTVIEVLGAVRDGLKANGWESEGVKDTRVFERSSGQYV